MEPQPERWIPLLPATARWLGLEQMRRAASRRRRVSTTTRPSWAQLKRAKPA